MHKCVWRLSKAYAPYSPSTCWTWTHIRQLVSPHTRFPLIYNEFVVPYIHLSIHILCANACNGHGPCSSHSTTATTSQSEWYVCACLLFHVRRDDEKGRLGLLSKHLSMAGIAINLPPCTEIEIIGRSGSISTITLRRRQTCLGACVVYVVGGYAVNVCVRGPT